MTYISYLLHGMSIWNSNVPPHNSVWYSHYFNLCVCARLPFVLYIIHSLYTLEPFPHYEEHLCSSFLMSCFRHVTTSLQYVTLHKKETHFCCLCFTFILLCCDNTLAPVKDGGSRYKVIKFNFVSSVSFHFY
jgi:hypothetical protein